MKEKKKLILACSIGLLIFLLIDFAIYHETYHFGQSLAKGLVFLTIFTVFEWLFNYRNKES